MDSAWEGKPFVRTTPGSKCPYRVGTRADELGELEDQIKIAILSGQTDDYALNIILGLLAEEKDGRALYDTPLKEPVLLRHIRGWVKTALEDRQSLNEMQENLASRQG